MSKDTAGTIHSSVFDKVNQNILLPRTKKPEAEKSDEEVAKRATGRVSVPPHYMEVKLTCTNGRLSAPPVLHFRNYTMREALLFSQVTDANSRETVIQVLNALVYEDFECALLHDQEAVEILLNIYARWWGTTIEGFYYAVDLDKPMEKENRSVAEISISKIHFTELPATFTEPIRIGSETEGLSVSLCLPRISFAPLIDSWLKEKFGQEEIGFSDYVYMVQENDRRTSQGRSDLLTIDSAVSRAYADFVRRHGLEAVRVGRAVTLLELNGVPLETLEDKVKALEQVPQTVWTVYDETVEAHRFGVDEEVEFICSVKKTAITRRFPFRLMDFVPPMDSRGIQPYSVSFG